MLNIQNSCQFSGFPTAALSTANGKEASHFPSILHPATSTNFLKSHQATKTMRDRRDQRIDPATGRYYSLPPWELQYLIPNYDVRTNIRNGWRVDPGNIYYSSDGMARHRYRENDYIVTRPEGYVPYQSVVQPDGRYAYNPDQHQYPYTRDQELDAGGIALLPQARQFEFMLNRNNHYPHRPGEAVEMGIDYSQMRTAATQPPQQATLDQYGRPVLLPGPAATQGSMGPPPNPAGGYGGDYGGQR
jgi:hypothetical protein